MLMLPQQGKGKGKARKQTRGPSATALAWRQGAVGRPSRRRRRHHQTRRRRPAWCRMRRALAQPVLGLPPLARLSATFEAAACEGHNMLHCTQPAAVHEACSGPWAVGSGPWGSRHLCCLVCCRLCLVYLVVYHGVVTCCVAGVALLRRRAGVRENRLELPQRHPGPLCQPALPQQWHLRAQPRRWGPVAASSSHAGRGGRGGRGALW